MSSVGSFSKLSGSSSRGGAADVAIQDPVDFFSAKALRNDENAEIRKNSIETVKVPGLRKCTVIRRTIHKKTMRCSVQKKSEQLLFKLQEFKRAYHEMPKLSDEEIQKMECYLLAGKRDLEKFQYALKTYLEYKAEGHWEIHRSWTRNWYPERFGLSEEDAKAWNPEPGDSHTRYLEKKVIFFTKITQAFQSDLQDDANKKQMAEQTFEILDVLERNSLGEHLKALVGDTTQRLWEVSERLRYLERKRIAITYECIPKVHGRRDLYFFCNHMRENLQEAESKLRQVHAFLSGVGAQIEAIDPYRTDFKMFYERAQEALGRLDMHEELVMLEKDRVSEELEQKNIAYHEILRLREQIQAFESSELRKIEAVKYYVSVSGRPEILQIVTQYRAEIDALLPKPPFNLPEVLERLQETWMSDFEGKVVEAKRRLDVETGKSLASASQLVFVDSEIPLTEAQVAQFNQGDELVLRTFASDLAEKLKDNSNFRPENLLEILKIKPSAQGNFCAVEYQGTDQDARFGIPEWAYQKTAYQLSLKQAQFLEEFLVMRMKSNRVSGNLFIEYEKDLENIRSTIAQFAQRA